MIPAKKHNAITNALASVYGQMFPGGKQEERILTTELYGHSCISPWQDNHVIQRS